MFNNRSILPHAHSFACQPSLLNFQAYGGATQVPKYFPTLFTSCAYRTAGVGDLMMFEYKSPT